MCLVDLRVGSIVVLAGLQPVSHSTDPPFVYLSESHSVSSVTLQNTGLDKQGPLGWDGGFAGLSGEVLSF